MNARDRSILVFLLLLSALLPPCTLARGDQRDSIVSVSTFWSHTGVRPGSEFTLALALDIRDPYHINAHNTKPPFIPTRVEILSAPDELRSSTPMFPEPREINFGTGDAKEQISVFSQRVVIFIPMAMNGSSGLGEVPIKFKISYLLFRSSFIACPGQDQPVN